MKDSYITVGEFIEKLKIFNKDIRVEVQYRDSGGAYPGTEPPSTYLHKMPDGEIVLLL